MADRPDRMQAVLLTGHGGLDMLEIVDAHPVPAPGKNEVLIKVGAAGVNNTDINTRIGWYSKSVRGETNEGSASGFTAADSTDSSWSGAAIGFPRIQGADACGHIVAVGPNVDAGRVGERVLVRAIQHQPPGEAGLNCITFGSEVDGGFAEYAVARSDMALAIDSHLSDVELASFPCAASTAENMLDRIELSGGERVLITGASGGVGSAAVQLAKRRGAHVVALASTAKHEFVKGLGADAALDRTAVPEPMSFDVVVDLVVGPGWNGFVNALKRGGRYITAGAIGGPISEIDLRTIYLRDLTIAGSTYQPPHIFENLVGYIERGEIRPVVSETYKLSQITDAQADFVAKKHPGKLVLVPDRLWHHQMQ